MSWGLSYPPGNEVRRHGKDIIKLYMNYTQAEPERINELEFKCKWIEPLLSSL
jgi:hypothetical protein